MMLRRCKNSASSARRGFTLTEIAIVLGIIGLILGAIWAAASAVYNNLRSSRAQQEILTVAQNIRAMYATQSTVDPAADYDGTNATNSTYIDAGIFPSDATVEVNNTKSVKNPWGGDFGVIAATVNNSANTGFSVIMRSVPQNACITLTTSTTGTGRDSGLQTLSINGAPVGDVNGGTFPVSASSAAQNCTNQAGGNAVIWTFRLRS